MSENVYDVIIIGAGSILSTLPKVNLDTKACPTSWINVLTTATYRPIIGIFTSTKAMLMKMSNLVNGSVIVSMMIKTPPI